MSYNLNASFDTEQAKLTGAYVVDMYCVNASKSGWEPYYYTNLNQDVYGYALDSDGDIGTTPTLYTGLPVKRGNLNTNLEGEISNVSITIPNVDRSIEGIVQTRNYLRGCDIYYMTTFAKYLPSGSGISYIGSTPDKNTVIKEKYIVDSTTSNQVSVTFACKSKFELSNITIPGRTFDITCSWAKGIGSGYLGTECDLDNNISATTFPTCDGSLENCKERSNISRFGGFPSIPRKGIIII